MSEENEQQILNPNKKILQVQYVLAVFYFLLGVLTVILANVIPNTGYNASVVFSVLGSLLTLAGLVQIFAVPYLACKKVEGEEE